ncbi:MAG: transposase [Clostridia bacterium]|nr:transposase [Clostridia bacterium]
MSRQARRKSESGIYHVMLRGINKQAIYVSETDHLRFLQILQKYKQECGFTLYAYCLMGNHVHLLIKETERCPLELIMKKIATSYAYWFNLSYQRTGHVFQDRFRSEPIDDDPYFLAVLRYIHQNPLKAGLCRRDLEYKWSSFADYKARRMDGLTDISFALGMVNHQELMEFIRTDNEDQCLDDEDVKVMSPEQMHTMCREISACERPEQFADLSRAEQTEAIKRCAAAGVSARKMAECFGVSRTFIKTRIKK